MPELPEVECLTLAVRAVLEGRRLAAVSFHRSNLRWPIPIEDFNQRMLGQTILQVRRRSKYLLLETEKGYGIFHLGMSGNLLLSEEKQPSWKHTHASLMIEGEAGGKPRYLHFVDPRRFGCILSCSSDELSQHPLFKDLGPEPLDCLDLGDHLAREAKGKSIAVKNFIMDAHRVVGVGNIYANEALFMAGIRPTRRAGSIKMQEWQNLALCIQKVLRAAIKAGGTSFRDYKHIDGESGYFEVALSVYGRAGEACLRCQKAIKLIKLGGRATYFCQNCQV